MKLSIIIPTYNRCDILVEHTLPALVAQDMDARDFEVIVVDDGSTDNTTDKVLAFQRTHSRLRLVYERQENRGPAAARNAALTKCTGKIVLFIGDDTFPEDSHFLSHRYELHLKLVDYHIGVLGFTRWYPSIENRFMQWLAQCDLQFAYNRMTSETFVSFGYGYTSNLSFARQLLFEAGQRFCERFTKAAGEDVEYCFRLTDKAKMRLYYHSGSVLYHFHIYSPSEYRRRCQHYALGKKELLSINPECYRQIHSQSRIKLLLKTLVGWGFALLPLDTALRWLMRAPPNLGRLIHYSYIQWEEHMLSRRIASAIDTRNAKS